MGFTFGTAYRDRKRPSNEANFRPGKYLMKTSSTTSGACTENVCYLKCKQNGIEYISKEKLYILLVNSYHSSKRNRFN